MKAYNQLKTLFFGVDKSISQAAGRAALRAQRQDVVLLSAQEAAFIYRQNQRIVRTLTPGCALFKKRGARPTAYGVLFVAPKNVLVLILLLTPRCSTLHRGFYMQKI